MTSPPPSNQPPTPPPNAPKTLMGAITQAVQTVQAKVNFSKLALKPNARVAELWVQDSESEKAEVYPLLGERYLLGRSSKSCDIVIRNPIVSQIHLSITRDSQRPNTPFVLKDENSTNGIYRGKRRLMNTPLRHGDVLTLGPPELAAAVRIQYVYPPPWYVKAARYGLYGFTGVTAATALWIGIEWQRFTVRPLPTSVQGPVAVYARDGVTELRPQTGRAHVELRQLADFSPYLADAVIASEDSRYYWHLGVDPIGILRALATNIQGGGIREGGSTITQQLSRNVFRDYVGTADSAGRKLREAIVALKLETFYSKDFLLLTYLNRVYLGNGNYGFEDAAQFYFGKSARDLTLSEAATLAGILPAPNSFNPIRDYGASVELRDRILNRMAAQGKVSLEDAQRARRSRIEINPDAIEELESTIAPYFYSQIFAELEELLGEQLAQEGNFIVESSLDPRLQTQAEASLQNAIANSGAAAGFSQGAVVTLDASTGGVLAMVGGASYQESQFNRATQALRQPGSTFKVFAYTAAIEQGISPGRSYSCAPLSWGGQSFAGCRSGAGSMDMYRGLALSENVISLRVAQEIGLDAVVRTARRMGIDSELNPVPGLVLGQSEVTLLELTGAYGVLANQGARNRPHTISRILDSSDCTNVDEPNTCRVIYDYSTDAEANVAVLPAPVANTMTNMLQGVIQSGTGRNAYLGVGEAGKTGTNNDNTDLWFVGYIPRTSVVTGVWFGNDDNAPTSGSSADAARLWGDYMGQVVQ
ncbi:transglycosylase domain-containing protein [Oculatella sp. LEGE 06141]|uniref:transglycosylase domain-containing protein n=1 Tax=Oculatella sp. LEGE 06141 TaxID=1828648 RepID=UPI00188292C2|nr:transglycosylase domain-containing protein [Oculatella sp. LEGE 06141]MBE9177599.1 transglycosylase domain-containing protein [Oculatella sp. LEGE 06141]